MKKECKVCKKRNGYFGEEFDTGTIEGQLSYIEHGLDHMLESLADKPKTENP